MNNENKKIFKSFHIKDKTIGSSNEISFNVLESKKLTEENEKAPSPWEISPEAVAKKKKKRLHSKAIAIAGVSFVVLAVLIAVILSVASFIQTQSGSNDKLFNQIKEVQKTSDDLSDLRETLQLLLKNDLDDLGVNITADKLSTLSGKAAKAKETLEKDKSSIEATLQEIATPAEKEAANNAITLINKELSLIATFQDVNYYANPFITAKESAESAMSLLVDADSKDREASQYLSSTSTDEVKKAIDSATEAKTLAASAKQKFNDIIYLSSQNNKLNLDDELMNGYVEYCDDIIAAQEATINVANAYVDRNKETLQEQNDKYNQLKEAAVTISKTWNKKLPEIIDEQYNSNREGNIEGFDLDMKERDSIYKSVKNYVDSKSK
ncbi:MAG: hypothetical protein Q3982_03725 [Phoenicibacter congonensis]|uniref:Uncharacterized protein n=1 Tax=Phoenicibacter congonensis TaxID=1944646 RepID=A0AA43UB69_9ACTN|nr:hypothetical protein [Phoenicibacter congonensis]